ncbi:preprotein translocase subunit SecD [Thermodesulfovibrio aggregans]|uniref:Protein translocase subunit SecD n=1 Tax=Thermodesulfovibrio aggregans TaxID=86166 RepID=A0A0U9HUD1_9BACT|nr:protein translocase subunit SecD [Thermodesulfovibrio aggregans]GAQ94433.1 preprotein translocase subunit SecD [Thermodesulfovibrio aggregans]
MRKGIYIRIALILATVIIAFIFFLPNTPLFEFMPDWWKKNMPHKGIVLGLDLRGGSHLIFEVDIKRARQITVERTGMHLGSLLEKKGIKASVKTEGEKIIIQPVNDEIKKLVKENYPDLSISQQNDVYVCEFPESAFKRVETTSVEQAIEVIRNRIDQLGVAEPAIHKQGENEIVVQLPGVKDPKKALEIIGKTAQLEFKLLDEETTLWNELPSLIKAGEEEAFLNQWKNKLPEGDEIVFQKIVNKETGEVYKRPYIVKKEALLTGDLLAEAHVSIDQRFNEPYVSLRFNDAGAKIFEEITAKYVKHRLAIILDGTLYSAPVIQERIEGGNAQITGSFTLEEAKDLAIVLRAGALPAPVRLIQNVTVGPTLGKDSIEAGKRAVIIAAVFVSLFMVFYYRLSGVIADFALILNIVLLIGALAALNATLTLPGIAGVALAIGMAVDSNVLMFERIREELRLGKTPKAAIESGYKKAFWTIFDSHVTTLITAAVLFHFGSGPIKGFAVTLSLGVAINLFTALIGTKTVFDFIYLGKERRSLSI